MTIEQFYKNPPRKVICTVKEAKGECVAGHKVGDVIELDGHTTGGLCGAFYHAIYPYIRILDSGGSLYGAEVLLKDCPDRANAITIEMRLKK